MAGWTPTRPERPVAPAAHGRAPVAGVRLADLTPVVAGVPPVPAPPADLPRRRRAPRLLGRLSPRSRVLAGFVSLTAAIAAITGIGASVTPRYGDLAPWRGLAVVDVRQAPTADGWSLDLGRAMLPSVPIRCASFRPLSGTSSLVLLAADSPSLGSSEYCAPQTVRQVDGTVGLVDPSTGTLRWHHDLSRDVESTAPLSLEGAFVDRASGRVLVAFTADGRLVIAALSLADGRMLERVEAPDRTIGAGPLVEGSLVAYAVSGSDDGSAHWVLTRIGALARPIWEGTLPGGTSVVLLRSALITRDDGRSIRVDGSTGRVTRFGDGDVPLTAIQEDGTDLVTSTTEASGVAITAWTPAGEVRWRRAGVGDTIALTRSCLITSLPGTSAISCLDRSTGATRWTRDLPSQGVPTGVLGQTTDDVAVFRSFGNHSVLMMLDGQTGRTRFTLDLTPGSTLAGASRTTGYAVTSSLSGSPIGYVAFDTRSGDVLWQRDVLDDGDTEMWGGHLVTLNDSGVVRELRAPEGVVLGR